MDQFKIGKFISKCRKDKELTQQELADKLGITDRAISHWENGRSLPDVSLYKELCNILDISVEELINGEKDNSEEAKEKALINTIKEHNKFKKNSKNILIILILIFISIISILIYHTYNNKINLIEDSNYLYEDVIDYLREQEFINNKYSTYEDFNVFFSYHPFGIEKKDNYKYVYMWIYNQSYYLEPIEYGGALAISSSLTTPIKAIFKDDLLESIIYPDESNYNKFIKDQYPTSIASKILKFKTDENINELFNKVEIQKNIYYDYLTIEMNNITLDDLNYDNLLLSVRYRKSDCDTPVQLNIYSDYTYTLYTGYESCLPNTICTSILSYTLPVTGTYNYDILDIIKHSEDANNYQFTDIYEIEYEITSGKGHQFVTNSNNRYIKEFLKSINVDLKQCAEPVYK